MRRKLGFDFGALSRRQLARRCEEALVDRTLAVWRGARRSLRRRARSATKPYRRSHRALSWLLRAIAGSAVFAASLLGIPVPNAHAELTSFTSLGPLQNGGVDLTMTLRSDPVLVDLDGDGDLDLVSGQGYGYLDMGYFRNAGTAMAPAFQPGGAPFNRLAYGAYFKLPDFGDLDNDGDYDLVVGHLGGGFYYFENTGSATSASFTERTGALNPFDGLFGGGNSRPTLVDLDDDGDLDLMSGNGGGGFAYFENTGTVSSAMFVARPGPANPLAGVSTGGHSRPAFGDLDGDGDLDMLSGTLLGAFAYWENTGSPSSPVLVLQGAALNPMSGVDLGAYSSLTLGDLDGDADYDLVTGEDQPAIFILFEGDGPAVVPPTHVPALPVWGRVAGVLGALFVGWRLPWLPTRPGARSSPNDPRSPPLV